MWLVWLYKSHVYFESDLTLPVTYMTLKVHESHIWLLRCTSSSHIWLKDSTSHSLRHVCGMYGVATCSRLLKILGLFCKRALWKRRYSAKVAYNFKEPTNRSHPIVVYDSKYTCGYIDVWLSCICTQVTCVTLRCTYEWVIYVTCLCCTRVICMSHMNESCHIWMSHVTYEWVMSHMNESCHIWMSHVTYEWVMSHMNAACHIWMSQQHLKVIYVTCVCCTRVMMHVTYEWVMNASCHTWMRHVTYEKVIWKSHEHLRVTYRVTYEWVMSHMNASRHTWMRHVTHRKVMSTWESHIWLVWQGHIYDLKVTYMTLKSHAWP